MLLLRFSAVWCFVTWHAVGIFGRRRVMCSSIVGWFSGIVVIGLLVFVFWFVSWRVAEFMKDPATMLFL